MKVYNVRFDAKIYQPKTQGAPTIGADALGRISVGGFDRVVAEDPQHARSIVAMKLRQRHRVASLKIGAAKPR